MGMTSCKTLVHTSEYGGMEGLAFHLRMTGKLFVYPKGTAPGKHTRVVFTLDDGQLLFFDDIRKFGQVRILCSEEKTSWTFWKNLGPEPLEMTAAEFAERFQSKAGIKSMLLDQSVVAGIGNIYADESLFRAGIRPEVPANALSFERLEHLHGCLVQVLLESIHECGSSIRDYRTARGDAGAFQNNFRVYGRAGQKCFVCGRKLSSCHAAGRTTVFCSHCQK
jgi:formamidopyrimidine-DNA glycosylase